MKNTFILITSLLLTQIPIQLVSSLPLQPAIAQVDEGILTPQQVQQTAKNISVRITSANNSGSGVIIAKKGSNYLILTNAHVIKRATKIEIQAPDGRKYTATPVNGGFNSKYDLALLQFTSQTKYTLANLAIAGSSLEAERIIYSAGFPFDSKDIRITSGEISQLSDLPFDNGTQIGYVTNKGEKTIRQGMSGGAIFDAQGNLLGINAVGIAPILPNYTYHDGSKPIPKLATKYARANWGIPIYNFLANVKADILYGYENLPKVEPQVPPTGYMAKLNSKARQMTVRIENSGGNGSGVIVAKEGNSYYVLTAKHVLQDYETNRKFTNSQIITYDQDRRSIAATVVAEGVDLAVVKFSSNSNYPVAKLGGYSTKDDDFAFVAGFPGRENINSPLWQWQLNPGFISSEATGQLKTETNQSFSNGYGLIYSSISYGGMSGGPVFDSNGNIIGIHGRTERSDLSSLGISIKTFVGLAKAKKMQVAPNLFNLLTIESNRPIALNSIDRSNVISTMERIPTPQVGDIGKRWLDYGNQLYRTRQYDKSLAAFDRAINKGEKILGNYGKASSLKAAKKLDLAAISIAQSIAAVSSTQRISYYYLWSKQSSILAESYKYEPALKSIEVAISLKPDDSILGHQKAGILSGLKNYAGAIAIYTDLIRIKPEWFFYANRGLTKKNMRDYKGALEDFNLIINLIPDSDIPYPFMAETKLNMGNYKGALKDANRSVEINSDLDFNYFTRAGVKILLGDYKGALKDANRSVQIKSDNDFNYQLRSNIKNILGDYKGALEDANQAIKINSGRDGNYSIRGLVKSTSGDDKGAIADFNKAIKINPENDINYLNRGNSKYKLGDKQGAIDDYNRAIKIDPSNGRSYGLRGKVKSDLEDKKGAIADFNKSIQLDPRSPEFYLSRGQIKLGFGDKQGAISDVTKSAELARQLGRIDLYEKLMSLVAELKKQ